MDSDSAALTVFEKAITVPLRRVLDTRLRSVVYVVLNGDISGFDIDAPNASGGCQTVRLTFDGGILELDWDNQAELRDRDIALYYHLAARSDDTENSGGLTALSATEASPWRTLLGEPLTDAIVQGYRLSDGRVSPQAVTLLFPTGQATVAIGIASHDPIVIGDGDEVLVFGAREWEDQRAGDRYTLVSLWEGSNVPGDDVREHV